MNLDNKVAIITGSASGLGRATTEYFIKEKGARVAVFDLNEEAGSALVEALGEDRLLFARVDVTDETSVAAAVTETIERFGAIHVCINGAGIPTPQKILDKAGNPAPLEQFARTVNVNLVGVYNVMAQCAARMTTNEPENGEERGVVINIASGAAFEGQIGQCAYASSKAGVVGLALPAARELAKLGIRVMSIAPGLFNTPMAQTLHPKVVDSLLSMVEFPKRFGEMEEFARLCAFIVENAYFNGECIRFDAAARLRPR